MSITTYSLPLHRQDSRPAAGLPERTAGRPMGVLRPAQGHPRALRRLTRSRAGGDLGDSLGTPQGHLIPELLSVSAAAKWIGVSQATMYRMIHAGDLPVEVFTNSRRMRLSRRQLERWLDGEAAPAKARKTRSATATFDDWLSRQEERPAGRRAAAPSRRPSGDRPLPTRGRTR